MIKKTVLVSLFFLYTLPPAALAEGQAFVRLGPGSNVAAAVSVSSRRGGSTASVFIRVGNRWVPTPWGYYIAAPAYGTPLAQGDWQPSGTDPTGALYINGYRVLPSGWLRVQVEPQDAEVLVNGFAVQTEKASGATNSIGLPVGKHHVEVRKDKLQTYLTELTVQQAREVLLQVTLDK